MNLHPYLVISSQGRYNPYIIADVTTAVTDANLNIVAVEQNALYGLNILLMIAEPISPQDSAQKARTRLLHNLQQFEHDLHVEIVTPDEMQRVVDKNLQVFTIIGRDKVGILKAISNALANFRVSIERMHHLAKGELVVLELWVDASELRDLSVLKEMFRLSIMATVKIVTMIHQDLTRCSSSPPPRPELDFLKRTVITLAAIKRA